MSVIRLSRHYSSYNYNNDYNSRTSFSDDDVPLTPVPRVERPENWRVSSVLPFSKGTKHQKYSARPDSYRSSTRTLDTSPPSSPQTTQPYSSRPDSYRSSRPDLSAPPSADGRRRAPSRARSHLSNKRGVFPPLPSRPESTTLPQAKHNRISIAYPEEVPIAPEDFNPDWRFRVAFFSLMIINLAAALDATSLSVALPTIAAKLNGTGIEAFWSGTSFLLTSTVLQPIFASFSHIFGRKPILMLSLAFFTVGAILCALAKNFTHMLVGRSVQGVGGGGIIVLTDIIITDIIPLRERGKWFGFVSIMWALGSVSGPVIGGAFAEKASWTWIFWINLPFIGIGAVLVPPFLKLHGRQEDFMEKVKRVDYIGSVIFVASVTAFLIPISWGGIQYPWNSWRTIAPLAAGTAGMGLFIAYENMLTGETTIPLSIFRNATTSIAFMNTFVHGVMLWSVLYYLPLYFEAVKGYSPIIAGVACFPETFTVAPCTVVVAITVQLTGHYRWALWSGWVIATTGMGVMYLLDVDTAAWKWIILNLVPGVGLGLLFPAMGFSIQASAPQKDAAGAVAMFTFFRGLGQSVGVAVGGVIFQNRMKAKLLTFPDIAPKAAEYAKDASALVQIIKQLPKDSPVRAELKIGYADALKWIWIVMCGLAGVAMLASFYSKSYTLDLGLETEQGWKGKEKPPKTDQKNGGRFENLP